MELEIDVLVFYDKVTDRIFAETSEKQRVLLNIKLYYLIPQLKRSYYSQFLILLTKSILCPTFRIFYPPRLHPCHLSLVHVPSRGQLTEVEAQGKASIRAPSPYPSVVKNGSMEGSLLQRTCTLQTRLLFQPII